MYNQIIETIQLSILEDEGIWKEPIVRIIPANDERLKTIKNISGAGDQIPWSPAEPFDILPDAKSIVCFFIPFQENIATSNINGAMASEEWAMAYIKTNSLIEKINDKIELLMARYGYKTGKIKATHNFDTEKLISNWSHRHIAYIAGLGTFGINNMLITKNGCCGRFGSIITNYEFDESENPACQAAAGDIQEKCLNKKDGSCGICQKKCPANAYQNGKFDRHKCYEQCLKNGEYHKKLGLADVCGKCLVGLPCSLKEP